MSQFILLLRGINVGGHRKILMAELKSVLTKLGLQQCMTYIQSGNVIFQSEKNDLNQLEDDIAAAILQHFGHNVPVIVISFENFKKIVVENPFAGAADIKELHCTFFKTIPQKENIKQLNELSFLPDEFVVTQNALYLKCGQNYRDSKMTPRLMEKNLGTICTTRNWKTTLKLLEIAESEQMN